MNFNESLAYYQTSAGWWFKYVSFSSLFGEDSHFDYIIFFKEAETTN